MALFDSGISSHSDIAGKSTKVSVDFTGGQPVIANASDRDGYGHGTHVTASLGAPGRNPTDFMRGVAPKASFVDLKVVGPDGTGLTSNLIQAIDWAIENKQQYEIKVANLSLGHPPVESYAQDPLCQAVERLVEAGIVTVVSAGNMGKSNDHSTIWGAISSPGNDPAVITVGAVNSQGTAAHSDDVGTTYSSRGPTYVDGFFKPDLSAPGNRGGRRDGAGVGAVPDALMEKELPLGLAHQPLQRLGGSNSGFPHHPTHRFCHRVRSPPADLMHLLCSPHQPAPPAGAVSRLTLKEESVAPLR